MIPGHMTIDITGRTSSGIILRLDEEGVTVQVGETLIRELLLILTGAHLQAQSASVETHAPITENVEEFPALGTDKGNAPATPPTIKDKKQPLPRERSGGSAKTYAQKYPDVRPGDACPVCAGTVSATRTGKATCVECKRRTYTSAALLFHTIRRQANQAASPSPVTGTALAQDEECAYSDVEEAVFSVARVRELIVAAMETPACIKAAAFAIVAEKSSYYLIAGERNFNPANLVAFGTLDKEGGKATWSVQAYGCDITRNAEGVVAAELAVKATAGQRMKKFERDS